jgi:hypothetical protein
MIVKVRAKPNVCTSADSLGVRRAFDAPLLDGKAWVGEFRRTAATSAYPSFCPAACAYRHSFDAS